MSTGEAIEHIPLERFNALYEPYAEAEDALVHPGYIDHMHEHGPSDSIDEQTWQNWKTEFPRPDPEELAELNANKDKAAQAIFDLASTVDPVNQARLLLALDGLHNPRHDYGAEVPDGNPVHVAVSYIDYENDWYQTMDGLITLAQLTGETFNLWGGAGNQYFPISAETERPEMRPRYDPDHWPELRDLNFDLDLYLRDFYPEQYEAKDPALLEKYQGIIDRLKASNGQPIVAVTGLKDCIRFDMALIQGAEMKIRNGGDNPKVGNILLDVFAEQWVFTHLDDPSRFIPELSRAGAQYRQGLLQIEELWLRDGELVNDYHEDIVLLIGNREIEDHIQAHPEHATVIDGMRTTYQTPELINMGVATLPQPDSPLIYLDDATRKRLIEKYKEQH